MRHEASNKQMDVVENGASDAQQVSDRPKVKWREVIVLPDKALDETQTFEVSRDAWVGAVRASKWFREEVEKGRIVLELAVSELSRATSVEDFNQKLDVLYDSSDEDLVWMDGETSIRTKGVPTLVPAE